MNNEFVSVPRETVSQLAYGELESASLTIRDELRALLAQPAAQHQGEPAAFGWWRVPLGLPLQGMFLSYDPEYSEDHIQVAIEHGFTVKRLYTHADTGEVAPSQIALSLQGKLKTVEQERDDLRTELSQCEAMAVMIEEREWAEHAGTGPVSSRVESAFTQLHNELSEARGTSDTLRARWDERDKLLREAARHATRMEPMTASPLNRIDDALSASPEPSAPKCTHPEGCTQCSWCGWAAPVERNDLALSYLRELANEAQDNGNDWTLWVQPRFELIRDAMDRASLDPEEVNLMASQEGWPREGVGGYTQDGYTFTQEEFNRFVDRLVSLAAMERKS